MSDFEDVPADEFEDVAASEFEDVQPQLEQTTRTDAVLSGLNTGVPGAAQLGAGMQSAADVALGRRASLLDAYRANRAAQESTKAAAQREHPGYYLAGNLPAAMATGMASAAAIPARAAAVAGPAVTRFVSNLVPTTLGNASEGRGGLDAVGATATDLLGGEAIGAGVNRVVHGVTKGAGELLNGARSVADDGLAWLGRSRLGKWLGDGASDAGNSADVRQAQADIKAAEAFRPQDVATSGAGLSDRLARAKLAGENRVDLGRNGNVGFDPGSEFGDDLLRVSDEAYDSALGKHAPEFKGVEDPIARMRDAAGKLRGDEAKAARKTAGTVPGRKKPQTDDSEDMGMWNFGRSGKTDVGEVPQSPVRALERDAPDVSRDGPLVRNPATKAEAKKRWGDADKPEGWDQRWKKNPSDDQQGDALRDEFRRRHSHESNPNFKAGEPRAEAKRTAAEMDAAAKNVSAEVRESQRSTWKSAIDSAKDKVETTQENIINKWHLDDKAAKAEKRLSEIARGRKAAETMTGVGAAVSGGTRGIAEAAMGAAGGKYLGKGALKTLDLAGAGGERLAKVASIADRLATRDDAVGRAAKWALSANGDAAIARLAALADMPEFTE